MVRVVAGCHRLFGCGRTTTGGDGTDGQWYANWRQRFRTRLVPGRFGSMDDDDSLGGESGSLAGRQGSAPRPSSQRSPSVARDVPLRSDVLNLMCRLGSPSVGEARIRECSATSEGGGE